MSEDYDLQRELAAAARIYHHKMDRAILQFILEGYSIKQLHVIEENGWHGNTFKFSARVVAYGPPLNVMRRVNAKDA